MQKAAIRILLEAGEPDALKDACPVREGGAGKGLRGTSLVSYFTLGPQGHPTSIQVPNILKHNLTACRSGQESILYVSD